MTEEQFVKISFREVFSFLLRGLLPALLVAGAAAVGAYFATRNPVPLYRSTAILLATRPGSGYSSTTNIIEPTQVDPDIYRSAVVQGGLLEKALTTVQDEAPTLAEIDSWSRRVKVRVDANLISGLVRIEVDDKNPELAAAVANAVADALLAWDRGRVGQNVQATVASLDRSLAVLSAQIVAAEQTGDEQTAQVLKSTREQRTAQLRSAEALSLSAVVLGLLEPFKAAVPDVVPVNDRTVFFAAVAFVLAFVLTYVFRFFLRVTDPRIRDSADLARVTGTQLLATIPHGTKAPSFLEAIARLSIALPHPNDDDGAGEGEPANPRTGRVFVVTSPTRSLERGLLARHLAVTYSRAGWNVLLVDADLKEGTVTASLPGVKQAPLLTDILMRGELRDATTISNSVGHELDFIQAGAVPVESSAALLSHRISQLIRLWRHRYDVVVIDTTSVAESAAALTMAREADATVLAAGRYRTKLSALDEAAKELRLAGSSFIGTVLVSPGSQRGSNAVPERRAGGASQTDARLEGSPRATVVQRGRSGT